MKTFILTNSRTPLRLIERSRRGLHAGETKTITALSEVDSDDASTWLVPAGAWSERWSRGDVVPEFQGASPLVLVGAVWQARHESVSSWREVLMATGGDLSALHEWPGLPVGSVWLNAAACVVLNEAETLDDVLRLALIKGWRVIRHTSLDGWMDECVRVLEAVTSLQRGGAERLVLDLHSSLVKSPLLTSRLCVVGSPTREPFATPEETIQLRVGIEPEARANALIEVMRHTGCDVLHAHLLDGEVIDLLTAAGVTVLLTLHNSRAGWQPGYEMMQGHGKLMLAACAQTVEREARALMPALPIRTAWNGIAPAIAGLGEAGAEALSSLASDAWRTSNEAPRPRSQPITLVSVANPRPQKRLDRLPGIVAALLARGYDAQLVLAGEAARENPVAANEVAKFCAAAERAGVADRVQRVGALDEAKLRELWAKADVLISTSEFEGLSLAQLEALRAGVRVVATNVGGVSEVGDESTGLWLVDREANADEFAETILLALASPQEPSLPKDFTTSATADRYHWLLRVALSWSLRQGKPQRGVLLVTNNFSIGGAQSSAARLLRAMREAGHEARAVVIQERDDHPTPGLVRLREAGVPVLMLPTPDLCAASIGLQALLDDLAISPPQCVLFWNVIPEYKLLIADALPDIPVWDVSPGEMLHASLHRWFAARRPGLPIRGSREYAALLAGVVVKQQAEVEQAHAAFGNRVYCIANGVPVPPLCPPRRVVSGGSIIIGTAARLHPHKRLEDLLDAMRLMSDLNVELHIAGDADGDGDAYAELLRRSAEGLPVRWLGALDDMEAFHTAVDVIAVISEPAGCPNAIIEAMAAGLPVVATAVGGAMDLIVDDESGLLVPAREAGSMAGALGRVCSDVALRLRLGEAAWRRARDHFSVERMRDDYVKCCLP